MRTSRRTFVTGVLGTAVAGWAAAPAVASTCGTGARVVAEEYVGPRMLDLSIASPALADTVEVRLLLPRGWTPCPDRDWPVFYLLHGGGDDYTSWTRETDVAELTEDVEVLVVMPTGGLAGFYSDWWNHGAGGPPRWETFHLRELRQILECDYGAGHRRAIAGLSMGGLGAMLYPARHPGAFRAAASYSGGVHTRLDDPPAPEFIMSVLAYLGFDPLALWGDPERQAHIWAAHNPYDLAHRLPPIPLYVSSGNGQPGPLDPPGTGSDPNEQIVGAMAEAFVWRLRKLGANLTANLYGPGTHTWPYWERELHRSFPMLMKSIGALTVSPTRATVVGHGPTR